MAKMELATMDKFEIANPYDGMSEEDIAELKEAMEDLDPEKSIICKSIKIPNGSSNAFSIESEEDPEDSDPQKTFEAVIVFTHKANAYWETAFGGGDGESSAPTCSAIDAKQGVVFETGELRSCDGCQFNEFGPDGTGKQCKNMRRLYLRLSGRPSLYLLTLPPTSMKDVNRQLATIMTTMKIPYSRLVMKFSLKKAESRQGIAYNKVVVEKAGMLPKNLWPVIDAMNKEIKSQYQSFQITADEGAPVAAAAPKVDADGFMPVENSLAGDQLPWEEA